MVGQMMIPQEDFCFGCYLFIYSFFFLFLFNFIVCSARKLQRRDTICKDPDPYRGFP